MRELPSVSSLNESALGNSWALGRHGYRAGSHRLNRDVAAPQDARRRPRPHRETDLTLPKAGYTTVGATDMEQGISIDFGRESDRLRAAGVKFWDDGSFGTGNVLLEEPYLNSKLMQEGLIIPRDTRGYSTLMKERLRDIV